MPGRGPAPKPEGERVNRRKRQLTTYEVTGEELYGPELPEDVLPAGEDWHPQTRAWWQAMRRYPTMRDALDADWQFLIDTALMHHTMWTKGRWEFAAEIRLRSAKFGVTPEDRRRLGVMIADPAEAARKQAIKTDGSGKVTSIESRRKRLSA